MPTIRAASSTTSNNRPGWVRKSRRGSNICATKHIGRSSKATGVQWKFWKCSWVHYSMQAIHTNEDERGTSGRTNSIGIVICAGRISGCLEGKCNGGPRERIIGI